MLNKIFKLANSARENSFAIENCEKILKTASLLQVTGITKIRFVAKTQPCKVILIIKPGDMA